MKNLAQRQTQNQIMNSSNDQSTKPKVLTAESFRMTVNDTIAQPLKKAKPFFSHLGVFFTTALLVFATLGNLATSLLVCTKDTLTLNGLVSLQGQTGTVLLSAIIYISCKKPPNADEDLVEQYRKESNCIGYLLQKYRFYFTVAVPLLIQNLCNFVAVFLYSGHFFNANCASAMNLMFAGFITATIYLIFIGCWSRMYL